MRQASPFGQGLRNGDCSSVAAAPKSELLPSEARGRWGRVLCQLVTAGAVILLSAARVVATPSCASVRVCIAIDGSGSITGSDFNLMTTGLADAVKDPSVVPQNGSVELSFIQFGSSVSTVVSPTLINSQASANSVASQLQGIAKDDGTTNMAGAINLCSSLITGSCGTSRQVINVVTDGEPNSEPDTVSARNAAISAGVGEINAEAVNASSSAFNFLLNQLVYPQPGIEAPPFTRPGFVIRTASFADFAQAVRGKIGQIVGPHGCSIDPPSATNPVGTQHSFIVSVQNSDSTAAVGVTVNVSIASGPNAGTSGSGTTNSSGMVSFQYTDTGGAGTDDIQASGTAAGGTSFSCSATKKWGTPPPPCTVSPASDTNPAGTQHTVTATFRTGDGSPAASAPVSVSISSGPNSPLLADAVTNASGQVVFTYTGGPNAGTDTIEFGGVVDDEVVHCSATKTWVVVPPTCDATPATAVNLVGAQHDMDVTVRHGSGAPAAGVTVNAAITSGPHAGGSASGTTDSNGQHGFFYTGTDPGTDTISFSGVVDGQPFSCSVTKTLKSPPPPCTVNPASDTNVTGTEHRVTATFTHGDNSAATGVSVSVSIASGPNAPLLADAVTNASGQVVFSYTGAAKAGTDVIQFSGAVDGQVVHCSANKTWQLPPPPCTVSPASDTNRIGTRHTITATFKRGTGAAAPGASVSISITSGPNAPFLADAVTNSSGQVTFSYTGGQNPGTDVIEFGGAVDGQTVHCSANKTWELPPPPPCTVSPASATNRVGTQHAVTATFKRGNGAAAPGTSVSISITSGPNAPLLADGVTNSSGQVTFSYTGGQNPGTDVIEFSGLVDDQVVHCSANKTWELPPPPPCTVSPASAANPIGTKHTLTATFKRGNGNPAPGTNVSISISSGPNAVVLADAITNANGQVTFGYTGGVKTGTDVIEFGGLVDGQAVHCSATKTWELPPPPPCTISPVFDTNPVRTNHTVSAVFRRGSGAPAVGTSVSISITSGPNAIFLADAVTNGSGQVSLGYTGGAKTGTDVIEFSGFVDGKVVTCSAHKTWIVAQPTCDAIPSTAVNRVGTDHVVTVLFRRSDGSPAAGVGVAVGISSGPNAPVLADAVADSNGVVAFGYTGGPDAGTDVIEFAGFVDDDIVRCNATKTWVDARPTCDAVPTADVNPVGTRHTATAIFRRGDGSPAAGAGVSISIATGPNALVLADAVANASGQVGWSYTGGPDPGTDVIEFSGFVDGEVVRCSATKTWVAVPPRCDVVPTAAVNLVGSEHLVAAIFRRGNGLPAAATAVSVSISSGPNALLLADGVTNRSGVMALSYRGGPNAGTDVIEFGGVVDGQVAHCTATKTWVAAQPTCETVPSVAVNPVGTRHTVAAIFRRGDGSPAGGAGVSISISAGPNALLLADAVTNGSGVVGLPYIGGPRPGTDFIEFAGFVDGQVVRCSATKTWVRAQPTCDVFPTTDVDPVGTDHTVTAFFRRGNGLPAAGAGVSISIAAGPNALLLADGVTNGNGQVALAYTGGPNAGTDIIEFSGFVDGQVVRCSAAKTWVAAQPTCSAVPSTDVNQVGTGHTVTAVFRRGNGAPAAAANVSISIPYGPNAPLLADGVTNANGQVTLAYTGGANAGTDVIEFGGVVDGQVVRCSATKTWVRVQPTCDAVPSTDVNPVGTQHTVNAVFRRGNGSPAPGVGVAISIVNGPNALRLFDAVTNATGQVGMSYVGGSTAGTDVIQFIGFVDGEVVRCNATKTWAPAQPTCDAAPTTAVNRMGTQHTVTASFRRGTGAPAVGAAVSINVKSGPNAPVLADGVTNANGTVAFSYTGGPNAGNDVIEFSAVVDSQVTRCSAAKTWVAAQPACDAVPRTATNPVGTQHSVTARFRRGNGAPAPGANVSISIASGPNAGVLADAVAGANGQVVWTYTGGRNAGTDVIEFSGVVDGQVTRCSAKKTWIAAQPSCDAASATALNSLGSKQTVTATFRKGNGAPAAGTSVAINISSGPNAGARANAVTSATGQVAWAYTGGQRAGTDVIEFSGTVDGQVVSCTATKNWDTARPSCDVTPATAVNRTGTRHTATAIFRKGDGTPAVGANVAANIAYGPNAPMRTDLVTSSSGQVAFAYNGGATAGTDVIEFSSTVDGQAVRCNANKTWVVAQAACDVAPATAVNGVGTRQAMTAIFRRSDGSPAAGANVAITIANGPNAPLHANATTNGSGQVAFAYTGGPNTGSDVIEFSSVVDGQTVRCSAAKTWAAAQPTCDAVPATAVNPVGTRHSVTATFRKGDGAPAAGVPVAIGFANAASSPLLADALTNASGQLTFSYTGRANAGTDVIEFSGVVDGQVVRCSANKTWVVAQPTCDAVPAMAVNPSGTQDTVSVTFRRGDGSPAAGAAVAISVAAGPNAPVLADAVTDGNGRAAFSYKGASAGTDVVEFSGVVDGQVVNCSATKTWVVAQATCDATPATAVNPAGTRHTVTATFLKGDGTPATGVHVAVGIADASRSPLLGDAVTDALGQVAFAYTGGANASSDVIEFSGVVDGQAVRCSASKVWGAAQPACEALPATAVNPVRTEHSVTATVRKADGSPVAGASVAINIGSGPNALRLADAVTNASGQVAFTYIGGPNPGTDVIEFSTFVDGQDVSCSATKTWVGSLVPTPTHTVTATPSPSPTRTPGICCVGDCHCDGQVTVDEILT